MKLRFYIWLILPVPFFFYGLFSKNFDLFFNSLLTEVLLLGNFFFFRKIAFRPEKIYHSISLFIFLTVFLGRGFHFYSYVPYWDKSLHFLSGILLTLIGCTLYASFGGNPKNRFLLYSFPLFFAIACAGLWEIYEFTVDQILGTISQNGSLPDTMWDMICGSLSSILAIVLLNKKHTP